MDNDKIGKFISMKRKEKNLTQNELGDKLYVTGKAVSKWERGQSLPDIAILEKLAEVLDTDIYQILQIENKKNKELNKENIEKILEEERKSLKKQSRKRITILLSIFLTLISVIIFQNISFGYNISHQRYNHQPDKLINIGVPKFSFFLKTNDESYSYKNLRGKEVLQNEVKRYLNTLDFLSCNDTIYYYDSTTDTSVVDYSVKNNLFFRTISYEIKNGNYCETLQVKKYLELLGDPTHSKYFEEENIYIYINTRINKEISTQFTASLTIIEYGKKGRIIENSTGTFEIVGNELIYTRNKFYDKAKDIDIPNQTSFIVKKERLILMNDYIPKLGDLLFLEKGDYLWEQQKKQ